MTRFTPSSPPHRRGFLRIARSLFLVVLLAGTALGPALGQSGQGTAPAAPVQVTDPHTLSRGGKAWLRMSDFPATDALGADLGHKQFSMVQSNPAGTHAVVVGTGENHQWLAVVELATGRIIDTRRLTEAGVSSVLWDPRGTTAAVSVVFGSGREGIVLLGVDGGFTNVGAADPAHRMDFVKNPRWSADGARLRATGRFVDDPTAGEVEFERASRKLHRASPASK